MGWSTLAVNTEVLDIVNDVCYRQTGLMNTWQAKDGIRWFYEIDTIKTDASNDTLFGNVYRESDGTQAGAFHIERGLLIQNHQSFSDLFALASKLKETKNYRIIR